MKCLLPLALILFTSACQIIPSDLLSLEARAIVVDNADLDLSDIQEDDIDLTGYGLHAAVFTPIVDIVAGIEEREFDDFDSPELDVGLRKRLLSIWKFTAYVEANLRYGFDLDTGDVSEDYFGWNAGFGALVNLTDRYFLNFRVVYDTTEIDISSGDVDVDGVLATVGVGVKF